ncbi:hypothetical protein ACFXGT_08225 [Streptomyces sp. NPDC059352]|uniref:hypothetical protein n=1 Tax=Streptomyces sp. NPDC059352 TaxID=3346810 RepID=UPI0036D10B5C
MTFEYRHDGDELLVVAEHDITGPGIAVLAESRVGESVTVHVPPDRVEEVVAGIRDAARTASGQQPETGPCACTHPQDRHLSACTECPCIGYAPTWPPTKRRIVPVCDQCGAPWATSHRCATAPAVGQPAEARTTDEARPPRNRWQVETYDPLAEYWGPGTPREDVDEARDRLTRISETRPTWSDGTPVERRLVRETTTWTVEDEESDGTWVPRYGRPLSLDEQATETLAAADKTVEDAR